MILKKRMPPLKRLIGNIITLIGLAFLFHCGYSAAQHRAYLRLVEDDDKFFPSRDELGELLVSVIIVLIGLSFSFMKLRSVESFRNCEHKSPEGLRSSPSFYSFRHRGLALSNMYIPPPRQPSPPPRPPTPPQLPRQNNSKSSSNGFGSSSSRSKRHGNKNKRSR